MVRKLIDFLAVMIFTFALLTISVKLFSNNTVLDDYLTVDDKPVSLIFLRTDDCVSCNKSIKDCVALLNSNIRSDVYAIVNAKRDIELKKISKFFKWQKNMIKLEDTMHENLRINKDCLVVVFDSEGNKLGEVSRYDRKAYNKLLKLFEGENI